MYIEIIYLYILKKKVGHKLHSIKRLFYLSATVEFYFFKTFIMSYFDYCSFLPKTTIQKICNFFNYYLKKLLKIDSKIRNFAYTKDENKIKLNETKYKA